MPAKEISVLIPARNEMFLAKTVKDLLEHSEADTEIIVVLDGAWAEPPVEQNPRVNVIYVPESVGQRAATDLAAKLSKAKYVVKVDAHCSFDQGWDKKMLESFKKEGDNNIIVPQMRNLHAFNWKCYKCGSQWYQGPTPTKCMRMDDRYHVSQNPDCNETRKFKRKLIWKPRKGTWNSSYSFDSEPHFQYFGDFKNRPEYTKDKIEKGITETMSLQGSFFMATRENYWKLNLGGDFGSWGNQGIQVACAMWLSGGRVLCNHKTWYAHMFRTQGGDFNFPYPHSHGKAMETKKKVWEYFFNGEFKHQKYPVSWLVEKFSPVPGWDETSLKKLKEQEK